jgi:hypothetical protein
VNERNISRELATSLVDTLKARGHILVVKGSSAAFARELDEIMAPVLVKIAPQLKPRSIVGGEVTSTFGHEAVDEAVEHMVIALVKTLMDSEHVEDVFAEDNVIRRDIFRVVRDALLSAEPVLEDDSSIRVRLDTLGYVASTVGKRAEAAILHKALERAAGVVEGKLGAFDPEAREATFFLEDSDPDLRLELEEAVADELWGLVEAGRVELPTIHRQVSLANEAPPAIPAALRRQIEIAANRVLRRTGCRAAWDLVDLRTMKVTFTPLSEQDARNAETQIAEFAREVDALLVEVVPAVPVPPARSSRRSAPSAALATGEEPAAKPAVSPRAPEPEVPVETAKARKKPARRAATPKTTKVTRSTAAPKAPAKRAAPKRTKAAATLAQKKKTRKAATKRAPAPPAKARKSPAKKR